MTAVQLKALCKEYGLKVSGKKADLQERLREHLLKPAVQSSSDELDEMSDEELFQSLVARGMSADGRKDRHEIVQLLREDMQFMSELQSAVPADSIGHSTILGALEAAAADSSATQEILASLNEKAREEPKFVDLSIRSLGMQPVKYTLGGAPSVTADVLRQLAGDPFEDPPRYGSVSSMQISGENVHVFILNSICFNFLGLRFFWWRNQRTRCLRCAVQPLRYRVD